MPCRRARARLCVAAARQSSANCAVQHAERPGFWFFQVPNNRNMFISAPRERSGAAGGMQGTARLVGQTAGAVVMTMLFSLLSPESAPRIGLALSTLLALAGGLVSVLRVCRGLGSWSIVPRSGPRFSAKKDATPKRYSIGPDSEIGSDTIERGVISVDRANSQIGCEMTQDNYGSREPQRMIRAYSGVSTSTFRRRSCGGSARRRSTARPPVWGAQSW